jgi:hypothetical protein
MVMFFSLYAASASSQTAIQGSHGDPAPRVVAQASSSNSNASEMGQKAGLMQRALRGMRGDNPDMDKLMLAVESLRNKYGEQADFKKAYQSTYDATMKSLDDQAATKEALKIYQSLQGSRN